MAKNRIGDLRREIGMNQKELGDKLGVAQTTVSAWETGKNEPDYKSIRSMTELFEVSADYLLGFNDDHIHRGLSTAEFEAKMERMKGQWEQEQEEREKQELLEEAEEERTGMSKQDREKLLEEFMVDDWKKNGLHIQYETYRVMLLMEHFNKAERKQALEHIQVIRKFSQSE